MYTGLKDTQPLRLGSGNLGSLSRGFLEPCTRHLGGELAPNHFAGIPSLAALKATIHQKVQEAGGSGGLLRGSRLSLMPRDKVWGPMGYVSLRQRLFDFCDHEGSAW